MRSNSLQLIIFWPVNQPTREIDGFMCLTVAGVPCPPPPPIPPILGAINYHHYVERARKQLPW